MGRKREVATEEPEVQEEEEMEEEEFDDEAPEEEPEPPARSASGRRRPGSSPRATVAKKQEGFTALLMQGNTYEYMGMKFRKGVPRPNIPMKYLKKFRTNGWFQVSGV